jgi:hypothetical protein
VVAGQTEDLGNSKSLKRPDDDIGAAQLATSVFQMSPIDLIRTSPHGRRGELRISLKVLGSDGYF